MSLCIEAVIQMFILYLHFQCNFLWYLTNCNDNHFLMNNRQLYRLGLNLLFNKARWWPMGCYNYSLLMCWQLTLYQTVGWNQTKLFCRIWSPVLASKYNNERFLTNWIRFIDMMLKHVHCIYRGEPIANTSRAPEYPPFKMWVLGFQ